MARIVISAKTLKQATRIARSENKGNGSRIDSSEERIKLGSGHLVGKMRYKKGVKKYAFSTKKVN